MNLSDINLNLPCLRVLSCSRSPKRRMSCTTSSKSTNSSNSIQSKNVDTFPVLIQLCIYPNEQYAYETMKLLLSSRYKYSPNVCDDFGCNVLMYTLRYHRYQIFDYLLDEISLDLNLRSKDRHGNTILHYAIIYAKDDTKIVEKLMNKFNRFRIKTDERNIFGFTPLLLATFCGRYDIVLNLLMKTDASPFVRDYVQSKNLIDYLEMDMKHQQLMRQIQNTERPVSLSRESTRLRVQIHQTLPPRSETPYHTVHPQLFKNFFETVLPQAVQDQSGSIRSSILQTLDIEYLSNDLVGLVHYVNQRYPRINTARKQGNTQATTKSALQRENSKTDVHEIFNLFDPGLRPKAIPPKPVIPQTVVPLKAANVKGPTTFKRLGTKLTVLAALSRSQVPNKSVGSLTITYTK